MRAMSLTGTGLLTLLLFCSTCTAGEIDDEQDETVLYQIGEVKYGVDLEPHHHVVKREANQQFRLAIRYDNSVQTQLSDDIRQRIQNVIIPQLKSFFESLLMVRRTAVPILLQRDCTGGSFFPTSINSTIRCASNCTPITYCGQSQVPDSDLKQCIQCNGSSSTCGAVGPGDGPGVSNADMVLYVSAVNTSLCVGSGGGPSTIAFATSCQLESGLDRPIAGSVNFCPSAFVGVTDSFIFTVAKHELIHALAFSTSLYPFWRDQQGEPRTPRDSNGFPSDSTDTLFWSNSTILPVTYTNWVTIGGSVSHSVNIVVTPTVVAEGRRHFNCPTLQGVELENQGGSGTVLSHWEKRILGNEIMTGILDGGPVLSNLTLALLEDSGWYKVDYSMGEYLAWGKDEGCTFASGSCLQYMRERINSQQSIAPFCNMSSRSNNDVTLGCTVDREFVAQCNLVQYTSDLTVDYQYFSDRRLGGGVDIADFCPYQKSFGYNNGRTTECKNSTNQLPSASNIQGETYGNSSACFLQPSQWRFGFTTTNVNGAGCYNYTCNSAGTTLTIFVIGYPYTCQQPGQTLTITAGQYQGQLTCPSSFERLCQDVPVIPVVTPSVTSTVTTPPSATPTEPPPPGSGSAVAYITNGLMIILTLLASIQVVAAAIV